MFIYIWPVWSLAWDSHWELTAHIAGQFQRGRRQPLDQVWCLIAYLIVIAYCTLDSNSYTYSILRTHKIWKFKIKSSEQNPWCGQMGLWFGCYSISWTKPVFWKGRFRSLVLKPAPCTLIIVWIMCSDRGAHWLLRLCCFADGHRAGHCVCCVPQCRRTHCSCQHKPSIPVS